MGNASLQVSLLALVPAVLLCVYIYRMDKVEKEPWWLLCLLFLGGGLVFYPALLGGDLVISGVDALFSDHWVHNGMMGLKEFDTSTMETVHWGVCSLLGFGLVQELAKWLVLVALTSRSKHFNSLFDGVVYASFVSLGFAVAENIYYAMDTGWDSLLLRAIASVPGQLLFGIVMGYCYTKWRKQAVANSLEQSLFSMGTVGRRRCGHSWVWLVVSLAAPVVVHGLYTFIAEYDNTTLGKAGFYLLIVVLYALCFTQVKRLSDADGAILGAARNTLWRKHLQLTAEQLGLSVPEEEITEDIVEETAAQEPAQEPDEGAFAKETKAAEEADHE